MPSRHLAPLLLAAVVTGATAFPAGGQAATPGHRTVTTAISATPEALWEALTDAAAYPAWNPTVEKIEGQLVAGGRITVFPRGRRAVTYVVSEFDPPTRMTWSGGLPLGLFTTTLTFTLRQGDDYRVIFTLREETSGPLADVFAPPAPGHKSSLELFAAALKRRTSLP